MKKAKIGLLGTGRLGFVHGENMQYRIPNIDLVMVCDANQESADRAAKALDTKVCYDFEEMLSNDEVEGVAIVSSSSMHCQHIKMAMEAGKHVFVEKPVSTSASELPIIYEAVSSRPQQVFMCGYHKRYDEEYRYVVDKIKEGLIGEPTLAKCTNRDPEAPPIEYMANGAGIFFDLCVHEFDVARWFLGSDPDTMYASGGVYVYDFMKQYDDIDCATVSMKMQNGTLALLDVSRNANYGCHIHEEVFGTDGCIQVGTIDKNTCIIYKDKKKYTETGPWFLQKFAKAYRNELEEFAQHILDGTYPEATVVDAIRVSQMAIVAKKSYDLGQPVKFDGTI
ncbi:MAG: Gfo/Idh/MocA family oxidoreductase [Christensenellales bacterium]|jgi:myo-inositol 2-dehydrogenase/D-chiro-inositol 1-dehydrogenase